MKIIDGVRSNSKLFKESPSYVTLHGEHGAQDSLHPAKS